MLQSKAAGKLPALPWSQMPTMMARPFEKWDYQYFATSLSDRAVPGMVLYEAAVGRFYGRPEDQDSIGGVIVEEICRVYERTPVALRPGDVVVDLGGHLGTFTRVALNAGARLVVASDVSFDKGEKRKFCNPQVAGAGTAGGIPFLGCVPSNVFWR